MTNPIEAFLILIGAVFALSCCVAGMVFAACIVCRWMQWAPINLTVHIHNNLQPE